MRLSTFSLLVLIFFCIDSLAKNHAHVITHSKHYLTHKTALPTKSTILNNSYIYANFFTGLYAPLVTQNGFYENNIPVSQYTYQNDFFINSTAGLGLGLGEYLGRNKHWFIAADFRLMPKSISNNLTDSFSVIGIGGRNSYTHKIKIIHSYDFNGILGFEVLPSGYIYLKAGGSKVKLKNNLTVYNGEVASSNPIFATSQINSTWGWLAGLGFRHVFNRWFDFFVDYSVYTYNQLQFVSFNLVTPVTGNIDSYSRSQKLHINTLVVGCDITLGD